jgi:hypothetical protein
MRITGMTSAVKWGCRRWLLADLGCCLKSSRKMILVAEFPTLTLENGTCKKYTQFSYSFEVKHTIWFDEKINDELEIVKKSFINVLIWYVRLDNALKLSKQPVVFIPDFVRACGPCILCAWLVS